MDNNFRILIVSSLSNYLEFISIIYSVFYSCFVLLEDKYMMKKCRNCNLSFSSKEFEIVFKPFTYKLLYLTSICGEMSAHAKTRKCENGGNTRKHEKHNECSGSVE